MSSSSSSSSSASEAKSSPMILSNPVPLHYDVNLTPDLRTKDQGGTFKFTGNVAISVRFDAPTSSVTLHAIDLGIETVTLNQQGSETAGTVTVNAENETITITFPSDAQAGEATLNFKYTADLSDQMKGFYRSTYTTTVNGVEQERLIATTQFEATSARRAIPCWDEPGAKATFGLTLNISADLLNSGYKAVSNMPIASQTDAGNGLTAVCFEKSPVMSTYLMAFVIGEFDFIEDRTEDGTLVRVFAPPGRAEEGRYALHIACRCLPFFTRYFEIGYPLPKLDLLAIPDFEAGAMENWGCVTYRETALLLKGNASSTQAKQWVALVVAHELAHQWFGNLVTMQWWHDLWLNEGFATWIEYLALDHIYPEWQIWSQFTAQDMSHSLALDAMTSSHPIQVEVNTSAEIDQVFDAISYCKGASVIRLLVHYLGESDFRKGIAAYLKKFQYKNAQTHDLWRCLSEASGKPVAETLQNWTAIVGFPVVHVTYKDDELKLSQVRFLADRPVSVEHAQSSWSIPLSATVAHTQPKFGSADVHPAYHGHSDHELGGSDRHPAARNFTTKKLFTLFSDRTDSLPLGRPCSQVSWVKLNAGQEVLCRVNYSGMMWKQLADAIRAGDSRLSADDRAGLQSDAFALVRANVLPIATLLDLIQAYSHEPTYHVWADLLTNIATLGALLKSTDMYPAWCRFGCSLLGSVAERIGYVRLPGEDHLTALLRTRVIGTLSAYGHGPTVDFALKTYESYIEAHRKGEDTSAVMSPDIAVSVFKAAMKSNGPKVFDELWQVYKQSQRNEDKVRILQSLGATRDHAILSKVLDLAFSDQVRPQDCFYAFAPIMGNPEGMELGWKYMQDNWDKLFQRYKDGAMVSRLIKQCGVFSTQAKLDELTQFLESHAKPSIDRAVKQTIEAVKGNVSWLERDGDAIRAFLANF